MKKLLLITLLFIGCKEKHYPDNKKSCNCSGISFDSAQYSDLSKEINDVVHINKSGEINLGLLHELMNEQDYLIQSILSKSFREATQTEINNWLNGYRLSTKDNRTFDDFGADYKFYITDCDTLNIFPLFGSDAINIIIPAKTKIKIKDEWMPYGHSNLYFMKDYSTTNYEIGSPTNKYRNMLLQQRDDYCCDTKLHEAYKKLKSFYF